MNQKLQKYFLVPLFLLLFGMALNLSAQEVIEFEAEDYDIVDPTDDPNDPNRPDTVWVEFDDPAASGGKYIKPIIGGKNAKYRGYNFTTTATEDTVFYVWIKTHSRGSWDHWGGKVWLNWDVDQSIVDQGGTAFPDQAQTYMLYKNDLHTPDTSLWRWWLSVDPRTGSKVHTLNLAAGDHTFYLRARDDNMHIDKIKITNDLNWRPEITYELEASNGNIYGQGISEDPEEYDKYKGEVNLTAPRVFADYPGASLDTVISAPVGSGTVGQYDIDDGNGNIVVRVQQAPGDYYLWLLVDFPSESSNSYWVGTGEEQEFPANWEGAVTSGLEWQRVTDENGDAKLFPMELGSWGNGQIINVKQQEEGTSLSRLVITNDSTYSPAIVGVEEEVNNIIPQKFEVNQNYPNPFNPSTTISYLLPEAGFVEVNVYNMIGQKVETLVNGNKTAGIYSVKWNAENFSSGIYFYSVKYGNQFTYNKMMLLK